MTDVAQQVSLAIANAIRDEINEILSKYDIPSEIYGQDVEIDATCVMLADRARRILDAQ